MRTDGGLNNRKGNWMRRSPLQILAALAATAILGLGAGAVVAPSEGLAQQHRSLVRLAPNEGPRQIKLGLNKSMIVELPREVREVIVSNPSQIDAVMQSSTRAFLIGKNPGEANILFTDQNGQQVAILEVVIERDFSALSGLIARLVPGAQVYVEAINGSIVLTGRVPTPIDATRAAEIAQAFVEKDKITSNAQGGGSADAGSSGVSSQGTTAATTETVEGGKIINMIVVEGREQVLLKVSVVEMQRNIIKQFGVNLDAIVNTGNFSFSALSSLPFPFAGALGNALVGVGWSDQTSSVAGVLQALEQNGLLHTLAEPNLTAISGETANFLAGGEFPIPIAQTGSGNDAAITVEFKKFGIGLAFTPVVMSAGLISLKISTEVSELSNEGAVVLQNITVPALKVRRAETTVELPSGGSLVIAGLLSDQSRQAISGYPGLKSLPVIGALFRSRDFQKNETELVVLVTPYLAKPAARQQLAMPDDGFAWASDVNTDLLGQMNRIYGRDPERAPVGAFTGDVGFIVE
jgi:pilus assembly protein CpaC